MEAASGVQAPRAVARVAGVVALAAGILVLAGYVFDVAYLTSVVPNWPRMVPATVLAFILCGLSLILVAPSHKLARERGRGRPFLAGLAAAGALLIGVGRLAEHARGTSSVIDGLWLVSFAVRADGALPSMAPATAFTFVLMGAALLLVHHSRWLRWGQGFSLLGLLSGWLGLSSYVYGGPPLTPHISMAVHTAALLMVLGAGTLAATSEVGIIALLTRDSPGGTSARRLLPAALLLPLVVAWVPLYAERAGWVSTEAGLAVFALCTVIGFGALVWVNAAGLDRSDRARREAQKALQQSEERTRLIIDNALDAVIMIDGTGRITGWSPQAESMFGWQRAEVVGRALAETIVPERYREAHRQGLRRYMETGEERVLNRRIELAAVRRDGREFPIELAITPVRARDAISFSAFVRDITDRVQADEALRASEERFRRMADDAPVMIWISGMDKRCTWFNRRWLDFVGRSMEQELGDGWAENVHPDDLERCVHTYATAFDARESFSMEYRLLRHDGAWRWLLDRGTPLGTGDQFSGFIGSCIDITEQREAADALRESERRLRTLAESLPHLVWTCRPDGWCDYLSPQWVEYTGQPEADQLGYGWAEHLHPDDRDRVRAEWAKATERGDRFDIEFRIRRADGAYRWFKTRAVPLRDASGTIVKWFGSNTDFEDHKQAESRLRAQLERLALLDQTTRAISQRQDLRSIFQVVVHRLEEDMPIDFGCVCLYEAARQAFRVTCVGIRSGPVAQRTGLPEGAELAVDSNGLSRCLLGQLVHESDITQSRLSFPQRLAEAGMGSLVIAPLIAESSVFGVVIAARTHAGGFSSGDCEFLRQLTDHVALAVHQAQLYGALQQAYDDLRRTQQTVMQQERLRALGQMASGVAHDINNALSPAALYVQALLEQEVTSPETIKEYLTISRRAIQDVSNTVARMRDFARQHEPPATSSAIDLNRTIAQVLELTRVRWSDMPLERGKVIRVLTALAPDLPPIAGADNEIRDALTNLILNAVDAMPEGGTLTLRSVAVAPEGSPSGTPALQVHVEVTDTGIGMDEETRSRCLEPFFTTKGERGTGMGLAMVFGMAQRHRGTLEIESAVGQGTTIRIIFPVTRDPVAAPGQSAARSTGTALRVLLVDDDPMLLKPLQAVLEREGHTVVTAEGGQAGIAAFEAARERGEHFDVVITDLGMPYVDGRKVAAAVKTRSPEVPVILLTGWGHGLSNESVTPSGVDRILSKPPILAELRATLAELASR